MAGREAACGEGGASMRKYVLLLFVLIVVVSGRAAAQETDETLLALKSEGSLYYYGLGRPQDYARALQCYLQAAVRGDAESQFIAGSMLYQGQGTETGAPDKAGGFKWLLQAAEQGTASPEAMNIIGAMYLRGSYVPQNYLEAVKWLKQAAKAGNRAACNDLAYLYYNGLGLERDYKKALALYTQAALQGDVLAQANAGLMYANGQGTETDRATGYAWYSLAASRGNSFAAINRNILMQDMEWDELNRAQAIALELYRRVEQIKEHAPLEEEPIFQNLQTP